MDSIWSSVGCRARTTAVTPDIANNSLYSSAAATQVCLVVISANSVESYFLRAKSTYRFAALCP